MAKLVYYSDRKPKRTYDDIDYITREDDGFLFGVRRGRVFIERWDRRPAVRVCWRDWTLFLFGILAAHALEFLSR